MTRPELPSLGDAPPLPGGCPELRRTADPERDQVLEEHLDAIPMLDRAQFDWLDGLATESRQSDGTAVLGVGDLLRRRRDFDRSHALHPRVTHVLPPDAVDPTLTVLAKHIDEYVRYRAYQYPAYIVECRNRSRRWSAIYPGDYRIEVADAVRDLRANRILTSIRGKQSLHERTVLERTAEQLECEGQTVEGVVTLLTDDSSPSEQCALVIEDRGGTLGRRSRDELVALCETLQRRFLAPVSIHISTHLTQDD